jgi:hypothetical protein
MHNPKPLDPKPENPAFYKPLNPQIARARALRYEGGTRRQETEKRRQWHGKRAQDLQS